MEFVEPPGPDPPYGGDDGAVEPEQLLVPHLPAPVLAIVLDHLPFDDVRKAIKAAKIFATDVASHVKTLNIMRTRELGYGNYRLIMRFRSVTCVKILCLVRVEYIYVFKDPLCLPVDDDSVDLILPFIGHFTDTVQTIYLGGFDRDEGFVPYESDSHSPEMIEHNHLIRSLMTGPNSFQYAFNKGRLPQHLKLIGLPNGCSEVPILEFRELARLGTRNCGFCKQICQSFPIDFVHDGLLMGQYGFCMNPGGFRQLSKERFGEAGGIQLEGICWLQQYFESELHLVEFLCEGKQNDFCNRLRLLELPREPDVVHITFFSEETMVELEGIIHRGFNPSILRFYDVIRFMYPTSGTYEDFRDGFVNDPSDYIILRSTFDRLISLGFPLKENSDLIIANDDDPVISDAIEEYANEMYGKRPAFGRPTTESH